MGSEHLSGPAFELWSEHDTSATKHLPLQISLTIAGVGVGVGGWEGMNLLPPRDFLRKLAQATPVPACPQHPVASPEGPSVCPLDAASAQLSQPGMRDSRRQLHPTKHPWVLQPLQGNRRSCQTEPFTATQTPRGGILRNKLPMKQLVTEPGQSLACLLWHS